MLLYYCLKCRKNTESENPKVTRTKNGRIMLLLNCAVCDSEKSKFIKQQEASWLLSNLGIKTSLSKIPLVGPPLFICIKKVNTMHKMNQVVNKILLADDKFMPDQNDLTYGDSKDLGRRTASDRILRDKAFNIAKNPKYGGYQRGLASMGYKFFDQKNFW